MGHDGLYLDTSLAVLPVSVRQMMAEAAISHDDLTDDEAMVSGTEIGEQ